MILFSAFFFLSSVFWMRSVIHPIGWALAEGLGALLLARLVLRKESLSIPRSDFLIPFLLLVLWTAVSLFWTQNFYATVMSFYKIVFLLILIVAFMNERELWKKSFRTAILFTGLAASLVLVFLYPWTARWMNDGNLYGAVLAQAGIIALDEAMSSEKQWKGAGLLIWIALALALLGSLGPILGLLGGGSLLIRTRARSTAMDRRAPRIFGGAVFLILIISLIPRSWKIFPFPDLWGRHFQETYAFERIQIGKDSLRYLRGHALLGSGLGSFRDVYPQYKTIAELRNASHAHDEPLTLLCELGLFGLFFFLWFIFYLRHLRKKFPDFWQDSLPWGAGLAASLVQAIFDFNLRYLPLLILAVFWISIILPERELRPDQRRRLALSMGIGLWSVLTLLPGAAYALFLKGNHARWASRLDPLNGFFRSETGRMRDLEIAIDLEPRNVWYRRRAAQFYWEDWKRTGNEASRTQALKEAQAAADLAPNVAQFQAELDRLREEILKGKSPG